MLRESKDGVETHNYNLLPTEQGALTIVRRSSSRSKPESCSTPTDEQLDSLDLDTEHLPAVDTPDACDKAALRYVLLHMYFFSIFRYASALNVAKVKLYIIERIKLLLHTPTIHMDDQRCLAAITSQNVQ